MKTEQKETALNMKVPSDIWIGTIHPSFKQDFSAYKDTVITEDGRAAHTFAPSEWNNHWSLFCTEFSLMHSYGAEQKMLNDSQ